MVTATMRRMLGQRADAGQLFVEADRCQLTRRPLLRTAQGADESVDASVDCESTLEPPNCPAAPGFQLAYDPELPAPHVRHQERVRVVGVVALLRAAAGSHPKGPDP